VIEDRKRYCRREPVGARLWRV